jgi:hypothetical protein
VSASFGLLKTISLARRESNTSPPQSAITVGIARKDGRQWLPKAADAVLYRAAYPQRGPCAFVAVRSVARIGFAAGRFADHSR